MVQRCPWTTERSRCSKVVRKSGGGCRGAARRLHGGVVVEPSRTTSALNALTTTAFCTSLLADCGESPTQATGMPSVVISGSRADTVLRVKQQKDI